MPALSHGLHRECTTAPNATHSSSSFVLFSVAIYIYNCHHVDVSINCTHQPFHVTLLDSNCQFMSKRKEHYGNQFHTLFVISLKTGDLMLQEAKQSGIVLVHTYRKSFQFFRINAERTAGPRTPLPIFCLFVCSTCQTVSKRVELSMYIYGKIHALHSSIRS